MVAWCDAVLRMSKDVLLALMLLEQSRRIRRDQFRT
jgi:hypothetical protein